MGNFIHTILILTSCSLVSTISFASVTYHPSDSEKLQQQQTVSVVEAGKRSHLKRKCSVALYSRKQSPTATKNHCTLMGVVVGPDGTPIPFSNIGLYQKDEMLGGTISDAKGAFVFGRMEVGKYDVRISSMGYVTRYLSGVEIEDMPVISVLIRLKKGLQYAEVVCSAVRPYCIMPCGAGCICECCVPVETPLSDEKSQTLGLLTVVDTVAFQSAESWQVLKKVRLSRNHGVFDRTLTGSSVELNRPIEQWGIPPEQVAANRPF